MEVMKREKRTGPAPKPKHALERLLGELVAEFPELLLPAENPGTLGPYAELWDAVEEKLLAILESGERSKVRLSILLLDWAKHGLPLREKNEAPARYR